MNKLDLRTANLKNPQSFPSTPTKPLIQKHYPHHPATVPGVLASLLLRRYCNALCGFGQVPSSLEPQFVHL